MPPRFNILVVGGEPELASRLRRLLNQHEHHIGHSQSGKSAIALLTGEKTDLVLLDMEGPGAEVKEVLRHIEKQCPDTLLIIVTSKASMKSSVGDLTPQAHDYLTAPVNDAELQKRVQNALRLKSLTDGQTQAQLVVTLEHQQLLSVFESIDHPIYISDLDTYEILYANKELRKKFGQVLGEKCHKVFQGHNSPCPFCTSTHVLRKNGGMPHVREFQNRESHQWYHCIDGILQWPEARTVRYRMTFDITKRKKTEEALRESEARYRQLVQNANSIIFRRDLEGRITFFNEFAQDFFGYGEDEIVGKNVIGTIVPETDSAGRDLRAMIMDIGEHPEQYASNENENVRKNGERVWISWTNRAIRDAEGKISEILCVGNDITARKDTERALRESEERFREMAALLPTVICEMDTELHVTYANKIGLQTFGFSQDDLDGGISALEFIHPGDREKLVDRLERIARGENVAATEYRLFTKAGSEVNALVNSAPVFKDGAIVGLRTSVTNITEQKKLEQQLQQAQKMEAIGTLAGGIAHDFNNLLMAIQGNVSLMLTDTDPTHPHFEKLMKVQQRIEGGAKLTTHLLGYARKGKYGVKPINLNQLLEESCETFGRTRKNIIISSSPTNDLLPVEGDPEQIEQVLMNLFVNAADAMPGGGKLIVETMNATQEAMDGKLYTPKPGEYVMLAVTDTGTGMDRETMERIFDPFFTTKKMGRGTGLGLASAYGIIKGHGGYIDVQSRPGQGSTFKLFLPVSEKQPTRPRRWSPEEPANGRETVLLVDDEEDIREVGRELLEVIGYHVLTAQDGEKAVRVYRENCLDIDIVLLDIVMPHAGGGEAFDRMKKINPDVKVLLCSGYSIEGEATEILARGGNGFIQKPFSMNQLADKIREVLEQH